MSKCKRISRIDELTCVSQNRGGVFWKDRGPYPPAPYVSGAVLKRIRRKAGISQTVMAKRVGCSRHAISYWETKAEPFCARFGVPSLLVRELGLLPNFPQSDFAHARDEVLPDKLTTTRATGGGVLALSAYEQARLNREMERLERREADKRSRHRQPCLAKTRKGHPCKILSEPGRRRCKFHGGKSTGPKTPEGKARIAAVQRKRWAKYRAESL